MTLRLMRTGLSSRSSDRTGWVGARFLSADRDGERRWNVICAVWWGEGLDDEIHLRTVLVALETAEVDASIWRIGDQPVEEGLVGPGMRQRLAELVKSHRRVRRLRDVMVRSYRDVGQGPGWLAEL